MNRLERGVRRLKYGLGLKDDSAVVAAVRPVYNAFLRALYGRRGLLRIIDRQEVIRVLPDQRYFQDDFEIQLFHFLRATIRPGDIVIEVGANVGFFTVPLARWVQPGGHVYAFEPSPRSRRALEHHLRLNEVADHVTISTMAISDRSGYADFFQEGTSGQNTLSPCHSRIPDAQRTEVKLTTIDDYCAERCIAPSLIKIDIEGYEFHALRGARKTLTSFQPLVVVELHPLNWAEIGVSHREGTDLLIEIGYRAMSLEGNSTPLTSYGHAILRPSA